MINSTSHFLPVARGSNIIYSTPYTSWNWMVRNEKAMNDERNSAISVGIEAHWKKQRHQSESIFEERGRRRRNQQQFIHICDIINCNCCEFHKSQKFLGKQISSILIGNCSVFLFQFFLFDNDNQQLFELFSILPIAYWFEFKLEILSHERSLNAKLIPCRMKLKRYFWLLRHWSNNQSTRIENRWAI